MTFKETFRKIVLPVAITGAMALTYVGCANKTEDKKPEPVKEYSFSAFGEKPLDFYSSDDGTAIELTDIDGDGDLDAVIAKYKRVEIWENKMPQKKSIKRTPQDTAYAFSAFGEKPLDFYSSDDGTGIAAGDLDGDGDKDIAIAKYKKVTFLENITSQKIYQK